MCLFICIICVGGEKDVFFLPNHRVVPAVSSAEVYSSLFYRVFVGRRGFIPPRGCVLERATVLPAPLLWRGRIAWLLSGRATRLALCARFAGSLVSWAF